jgi:hypothetical protein
MKNQLKVLLLALFCLWFGVLIYATLRPADLLLNQWIAPVGGELARSLLLTYFSHISIPPWIIYSLPDGLWMLSLTLCILMIWNFNLHRQSITWLAIAGLTGITIELSQGLHALPGSFDTGDLVLMFLGFLLPLSFFFVKFRLCKTV